MSDTVAGAQRLRELLARAKPEHYPGECGHCGIDEGDAADCPTLKFIAEVDAALQSTLPAPAQECEFGYADGCKKAYSDPANYCPSCSALQPSTPAPEPPARVEQLEQERDALQAALGDKTLKLIARGRLCADGLRAQLAKAYEKSRERKQRLRDLLAAKEAAEAQVATLTAERDAWKNAIIDAAVVGWTYTKEHETDPRLAINALLVQAQREALDPTVSSEVAAWQAEQTRLRAALENLTATGYLLQEENRYGRTISMGTRKLFRERLDAAHEVLQPLTPSEEPKP